MIMRHAFVAEKLELYGWHTGAFGAVVPVNPDWAAVLQDMRLCMNKTSRGNSRKDVLELRSANSTFVR